MKIAHYSWLLQTTLFIDGEADSCDPQRAEPIWPVYGMLEQRPDFRKAADILCLMDANLGFKESWVVEGIMEDLSHTIVECLKR